MTKALDRLEAREAITVEEATALLSASGDELDRLCAVAADIRDQRLHTAGREIDGRGIITYSPKVFIPLTRLCRDRCHYCTFVETPGQAARAGREPYLRPDEVLRIAADGAALGCLEALLTLGDRPEARWPEAQTWLSEHGYSSTLDYARAMGERILSETGLLPHLNPGVMSYDELAWLKPHFPSMGMMLETTSSRLFTTRGLAHYGSPDKDPAVRLQVLDDAGRLQIPFTSGILVGIGETLEERAQTIFALHDASQKHGAIQEIIVQNFRAKPDTAMRHRDDLDLQEYRAALAVTRVVLGPTVCIQAPPNLVDLQDCEALLAAGVDDWGGVSPLTPDHVNPERPWPTLDRLRDITRQCGFELGARLTVQPEFIRGDVPRGKWLGDRVAEATHSLAAHTGPYTGLAADQHRFSAPTHARQ